MNVGRISAARFALALGLLAGVLGLASCGGGSSSSGNTNNPPVNNTQAVQVNLGPANNLANGLFTDVTVCVPGTTNCQTISNIAVDTGSEGLRILSSQISLSLPQITDNSSNALQECVSFADGSYVWGPVVSADIKLAGETAASNPIQIISDTPPFPVPAACASGGGPNQNSVAALGANGLLGIGVFQQDCGFACTSSSSQLPPVYYLCPSSFCQIASVPLNTQLQNPVWTFSRDNNGVLITLPTVPADGAPSASGSLIFGIGTQTDNALGSAQVYTTDANGNFQTTFSNNVAYTSYIDSGSNGIFFLDPTTLGIPNCTDNPSFYCPASTATYTANNKGANGTTGAVSFSIANADALFNANSGTNAAFNDLGGENPGAFDWGMPFFFGRTVFVGIENMTGPNSVVGPYWAY
jgi:hypothetical protein